MLRREIQRGHRNKGRKPFNSLSKVFLITLTGMQYRENVKISHITAIPVDQSNCKKKVWKTETELITECLKFIYLGFINLKVVKNLSFIN